VRQQVVYPILSFLVAAANTWARRHRRDVAAVVAKFWQAEIQLLGRLGPALSNSFCARVEPDPHRDRLYFDSEVTGLALRFTKRGARSFTLEYQVGRYRKRLTIGTFRDPWTVGEARAEARR